MSKTTGAARKSPLKDKPLRNPGQSLDEEIDRLFTEDAVPYIMVSVMVIMLAALVWWWALFDAKPNPYFVSFAAVLVVAFSAYKVIRLRERVQRLKLGRDGEKIVGQHLEELRQSGCIVFHDILGDGFNIDHVIVSPSGIFTVETKTYSKLVRGEAEIKYDGQTILVNGFQTDRNLVAQAAAQKNYLSEILAESTGKHFPIRATVVFPGWYVKTPSGKASQYEVWVLNDKALVKWIQNRRAVLAQEDVRLAAYHLSRFIQATARGM